MISIGYIVFIVLMFYLLLIRPQRKQKRERNTMMNSLGVGDEIYTIGGILGTITRIKEHTIWLRISEKCEIELLKSSIGGLNNRIDE
ncbi:MAG: preprotein translocase subunit YajC [Bacillota bacterium]|nr:preprotein translocase subunit YajC [Bacillota bacterium]